MVTTVEVFETQSLIPTTVFLKATFILTIRPNDLKFTYHSANSYDNAKVDAL